MEEAVDEGDEEAVGGKELKEMFHGAGELNVWWVRVLISSSDMAASRITACHGSEAGRRR